MASVENFPTVVYLEVYDCPKLKRINCLFMLHKIRIIRCPNVEVLEGVPALDSLVLEDATMEALSRIPDRCEPKVPRARLQHGAV